MMPSDIIAALAAERRAAWLAQASRPRTHLFARVSASLLGRAQRRPALPGRWALPRRRVVSLGRHVLPGRCD